MKKLIFFLFILSIAAFAFAGGGKEEAAGVVKVGLVTDVGKVDDKTFNQFAYEGMMRAAKDFGFEANFIETQQPTDYEKNIQTFAEEGYNVIVTVGFLITDATYKMAEQYPDIKFVGVDQFFENARENTLGLGFAEDQSGFIAGALAAMMSKSGVIGFVGGIEIPPVIKFRKGYENGAKYINRNIKILGVYIDSFTAPDRGKAAAEAQIADGADVIFGAGGPTGSGGIVAAMEKRVYGIGVDQDEYFTTMGGGPAPYLLTSAMKRVDNAVYNALESYHKDTYEGGYYVGTAANGGVGYAPFHDAASKVPQDVKNRLDEILKKLSDGSLTTGVTL
ncbi:MAG: BMP family ABC transporter substrate-binding protein [Spirochaetales bacterium]|nr:BMP family ABC transporter substrate-binding protein [Spirochaetales bacterium]